MIPPLLSSGEQEVLSWFYLLFTPNFIDGHLSPPPVGPVYDIIVHQAGGVDHLRDHGNGTLSWQQIAAETRAHMLKCIEGYCCLFFAS